MPVAEDYVHEYYVALDRGRPSIASCFVPVTTLPDGQSLPSILYCGNIIPSPQDVQNLFEKEMPPMHLEVQSLDCQVINQNSASGVSAVSSGKNISVLVMVSGHAKVGPPKESELRGFSETLVLVPNPEAAQPKGRGKRSKEWLIQSSNFRFVV